MTKNQQIRTRKENLFFFPSPFSAQLMPRPGRGLRAARRSQSASRSFRARRESNAMKAAAGTGAERRPKNTENSAHNVYNKKTNSIK